MSAPTGRPTKYGDRVNTNMRLPRGLHERLVAAAEERCVSVNWLVERAVADFVDRLIPADEIVLTRPRDDERKKER